MHALRFVFEWIVSDKSLAPATWGLVVVTALLVIDGWRKSAEQTRRWEHEDKRRKQEAKPKAIVELATYADAPSQMLFACFNLGNNTFFIDRMIVIASDGTRSENDLSPQVVTPGTWVTVAYDPAELLGIYGENSQFKEANCIFVLKGATGVTSTEPVWFYVGYGRDRADWHKGRLVDRQPGAIPAQAKVLRRVEKPQTHEGPI